MATPKIKVASQYDYDNQEKPGVDFPLNDALSRSVTNQSDKDSVDINIIMARYEKTGFIMDPITGEGRKPVYGDFSNVGDYHQLQNTIAKVREAFEAYPASIKNKFKNDPHQLIEFLADPNNDPEAVELGLKTLTPAQIAAQDSAAAAAAAKQAADARAAAAAAGAGPAA